MSLLSAIFLGLVQGITEFLPISSSGHLAIAQQLLNSSVGAEVPGFFDVLLHLGTLFAVFAAYWEDIKDMVVELFCGVRDLARHSTPTPVPPARRMILLIIVGTLPLFVVLPIKDLVDGLYNYGDVAGIAELTISAEVQKAALKAMGDHKGTIAVYNYKTGEILCAVTTPTYDPDDVPDVEGDETGAYEGIYLNRFVQSVYIPGSIFKIVTTAAALEHIPDIMDRTFTCEGVYKYGIDKVSCEKAHGNKNLQQALASSCNCVFGQIANLVGAENLQKSAERFMITESVRFDGVTTAEGNFDLTDAASVEIAWGGIGQYTDQINPCRFMTFMGAIAGGGEAAQPHLVSRVRLGDETTYEANAESTDRIMDEEIAQTIQGFMRRNVKDVYGAKQFGDLTVCAKSGTSQLGGGQKSNAMFAGFVTDEEYPLAFIVVVENGGYGASTCAPIISKVLDACKSVLDGE